MKRRISLLVLPHCNGVMTLWCLTPAARIGQLNSLLAELDEKLEKAQNQGVSMDTDEFRKIRAQRDAALEEIEQTEMDAGATYVNIKIEIKGE